MQNYCVVFLYRNCFLTSMGWMEKERLFGGWRAQDYLGMQNWNARITKWEGFLNWYRVLISNSKFGENVVAPPGKFHLTTSVGHGPPENFGGDNSGRTGPPENFGGDNSGRTGPPENFPSPPDNFRGGAGGGGGNVNFSHTNKYWEKLVYIMRRGCLCKTGVIGR